MLLPGNARRAGESQAALDHGAGGLVIAGGCTCSWGVQGECKGLYSPI